MMEMALHDLLAVAAVVIATLLIIGVIVSVVPTDPSPEDF